MKEKTKVKTATKSSGKAEKADKTEKSNKAEIGSETGKKKETREIVVPGQIVSEGLDYLPGDGTARDGKNIIATRFGLLDNVGRLVKVIALTGTYFPKKDDIIVGEVTDITPVGWLVSFDSITTGMLTLAEGTREYVEKNADLTKYYKFGDFVTARVVVVKPRTVDLSIKGPGLRKLDQGLIVRINSNKVPRVIGRSGSMVNLIKNETNCNIVVGQNGLIWVSGRNIESELLAQEAIKQVEANSHMPELTERIKDFLEKANKK